MYNVDPKQSKTGVFNKITKSFNYLFSHNLRLKGQKDGNDDMEFSKWEIFCDGIQYNMCSRKTSNTLHI